MCTWATKKKAVDVNNSKATLAYEVTSIEHYL